MLRPCHDRVLVEVVNEAVEELASGLLLPDTVDPETGQRRSKTALRGTVVAVGPGRQGVSDDGKSYYFAPVCPTRKTEAGGRLPIDARQADWPHQDGIEPGDTVYFGGYAGL